MVNVMGPRLGRATLNDVAAAAGVSKSTVSRILDERLPRSENKTAQRVRKLAAELGYVRDAAAASLRRGKTMTFGVIVPRLTDTVMAIFYEAFARACGRTGRFAIVATTEDIPDNDRTAAETLLQRGVDGLVLTTARFGDEFPGELETRGVPHVLAIRTDGKSLSSVGDDDLGGYLATRHLIDLGHTRIGLIAGPSYASSARGRAEGYRRALVEAGLDPDPDCIVESAFSIEAGAEATEKLARLSERPTAIFAVNDNTAIGAWSTLSRLGISVPEGMSLIGYNDIPIVSNLPTPMTTVRVPFDQIASSALELLTADAIEEKDRIRITAPTLIPRRTTGHPT